MFNLWFIERFHMGIALLSIHSLCHAVGHWLNPPRATLYTNSARTSNPAWRARSRIHPQQWAVPSTHAPAKVLPATARPQSAAPLRVLHLSEADAHPHNAGRMRISGRMADVCAELDRLVAKEAQNLVH